MKLQQLRTFVAVAEHRSIRAAARALFVSQPAVTRTIRELERDLDVSLLRRSVSGVELTDAGLAFSVRANLLLEEMRRAREELLFMKAGGHGHVAAAVTSTVGLTLLPDALAAFRQRLPQARLSLTEDGGATALQKLQNGTLDFVIANTVPDSLPSEFDQQPLFLMQLMVGARNDHPCAAAESIQELQDQYWVVPSLNMEFVSRLFVSRGLSEPSQVLSCESFGIATHLVASMDLIGLFSAALFDKVLVPLGVRALALRETLPPIEVSILTLRGSRLTPTAQCFVECLQAVPLPDGMLASGRE
ncbi:LysR substrate-binding domain-containing protein [Paraburkholderia sp. J67]|uniref:LysR substrate-binding domain-containing protein n=1 Tax=Paraburkholderia sp. J67 TaxID=2805435 RepID=UPI002ABD9728|nr:LysR substrate-binding domain-containing protein [Paraburkholderia sp. J67]